MTVYFSDLTDYNQGIDMDMILNKYKIYFEGKFSIDHVIYAIHEHCKRSKEVPRVSDLNAILDPEPPKTTVGEYLQAKKEYERNGFNQHSSEYQVIKDYEAQKEAEKEKFNITNQRILEIAQGAIKRIG